LSAVRTEHSELTGNDNWKKYFLFSLGLVNQLVRVTCVCVCKGGVWSVCTCLLLIMECIHFTYRIIFIMPQLQYSTLAQQQQLYPVVTWDTLGLLSMFWYSGLAHCSSRFRYCLLVLAYFWLSGLAYKVDKARFGLKSTKSLCEVGHGVFACKLVFQTEHSIILIFL